MTNKKDTLYHNPDWCVFVHKLSCVELLFKVRFLMAIKEYGYGRCKHCGLTYLNVDFINARTIGFCSTECWMKFVGLTFIELCDSEKDNQCTQLIDDFIRLYPDNQIDFVDDDKITVYPSSKPEYNIEFMSYLLSFSENDDNGNFYKDTKKKSLAGAAFYLLKCYSAQFIKLHKPEEERKAPVPLTAQEKRLALIENVKQVIGVMSAPKKELT